MRRGQAEFVAIIGIVVLAIVAIFFSFRPDLQLSTVPTEIAQLQKEVKDSFTTLAKSGSDEILEIMETHGGYLSVGVLENQAEFSVVPSEVFLGQGVPYWQYCQNDVSPSKDDVTSWMETGMYIYILENIGALGKTFQKDVKFDASELNVDANILNGKIDFSITLPTTVQDYSIKQPYTLAVPTNFGRILDFAKDFSKESADSRFFEYFTLASMLYSQNSHDGYPELPTIGFLVDCGEVIHRSPGEVSDTLESIISYTLADILWWQDMPKSTTEPKVYAIQDVNGKKYEDLDPKFYLPDDFGIVFKKPVVITNTKDILKSINVLTIHNCMSYYNQKYSISYPVITRVKDSLTGNNFHFASLAFIDSAGELQFMKPGSCDSVPEAGTEEPSCNPSCTGRLTVSDYSGNRLEGAAVVFGDCFVGETNHWGVLEAPILCGKNNLSVYYNEKHDFFFAEVHSDEIKPSKNKAIKLHKKPKLTIKYFELAEDCAATPVDNEMVTSFLTLSNGNQFSLVNTGNVEIPGDCAEIPGECIAAFAGHTLTEISAENIPGGAAEVETWVSNPEKQKQNPDTLIPQILIKSSFDFPEEDSTLNYYVPRSEVYVDRALECIDGSGDAPKSVCSPYVSYCEDDCWELMTRAERVAATYLYMTEELEGGELTKPSAPTEFSETLEKCGKEMIEIA